MARIIPTDAAWKDCPRADECSVNNCPLTLTRHKSDPSDPENKCAYGKTGRMRIGKKWKLENLGLKGRELSSKRKWENVPKKNIIFEPHVQNRKKGLCDGSVGLDEEVKE